MKLKAMKHMTEFKPSRKKWIAVSAFSFVCLIVGLEEVYDSSFFLGFSLVAIGGCAGVISLAVLIFDRMILRLSSEGFGFGTLRRRYFYKWSDVVVFGVGSAGELRACFILKSSCRIDDKIRKINRSTIGFDGFLPDTYGKTPKELAEILEEWRSRYGDEVSLQ